jgi:hypothetical protein
MAEEFTLEKFAQHTGSQFLMHLQDSQTVGLELDSVKDLGSSAQHIQFSLIFKGPTSAPIEQKIYRLDHPDLGPLDLFLVPIARDQAGVQYEAIVNRSFK